MSFFTIFLIWVAYVVIASVLKSLKNKKRAGSFPELQDLNQKIEDLTKGMQKSDPNSRTQSAMQYFEDRFKPKNQLIRENTSSKTNTSNQTKTTYSQQVNHPVSSTESEGGLEYESNAYKLTSQEDLKRAFVWSEILKRKYQ